MQLMTSLINCTSSSQRLVQRVRFVYVTLYQISVKHFEFNLNKNIDFAARLAIVSSALSRHNFGKNKFKILLSTGKNCLL